MNREATRLVAIATPILLIVAAVTWLNGQDALGPSFGVPSAAPTGGAPAESARPRPETPGLVAPDSPAIAAPGSSVTVVEFLDFECEACGAAFPIVKRILAEYEGRVTYVVRDLPNHANSVLAASAAYAADEQGKYWEMYDLLLERQTAWAERQESQAEVFLGFAQELGLEMVKFRADLESDKYVDRLQRDVEAARALGVDGTPTFFINGTMFDGILPYGDFKREIDDAIAAGS
ncbi:MAG: DsbA family protein [Candidatus Limnocylindrales bacterium]